MTDISNGFLGAMSIVQLEEKPESHRQARKRVRDRGPVSVGLRSFRVVIILGCYLVVVAVIVVVCYVADLSELFLTIALLCSIRSSGAGAGMLLARAVSLLAS
jgi:uncharacterized membrane protein